MREHEVLQQQHSENSNGNTRPESTTSSLQNNNSNKKPRLVFTDIQRRTLLAIFRETRRPNKEMQATIAEQLGLKVSTVANFFMNARRRSLDKYLDDDVVHRSCQLNSGGNLGSTGGLGIGSLPNASSYSELTENNNCLENAPPNGLRVSSRVQLDERSFNKNNAFNLHHQAHQQHHLVPHNNSNNNNNNDLYNNNNNNNTNLHHHHHLLYQQREVDY